MANQLYAGFARVNITPMMGIGLAGYYQEREADGVLDDIEINALALQCGEDKALLLSIDHLGLESDVTTDYRKHIEEVTGVPIEGIYIHSTHTHTAPYLRRDKDDILIQEYDRMVYRRMADVSEAALEDLKPAKMGWGIGDAPNIAFIRRFRMKDGSVKTNPGVDNPDILHPIGDVDERVTVLRFERKGAENIVYVNFANHADVVGGSKISADWPGFLRKTVEQSLNNVKCIFFNGVEGDVNHVNVHPSGGYLNDMFMDFDGVARGYLHARYLGRVVAGGVLQAYDKVKYIDVDSLKCKNHVFKLPSNMPNPEEMEEAHRINELHLAGRDDELPYEGMMLTTKVAEAARRVRLEHGPEYFEMELIGITIGGVALVGIPGEPFTGVGRRIKEIEGYELVIPTCLTNGKLGYFPMKDAYDEGGYEAGCSNFKRGVAELIIEESKNLVRDLTYMRKRGA